MTRQEINDVCGRAHEFFSGYGKITAVGHNNNNSNLHIFVYFEKFNPKISLKEIPKEFEGISCTIEKHGKILPLGK